MNPFKRIEIGKEDKNGKPIREGDILKVRCDLYSSSAWYQKTNKRHFDNYYMEYILLYDKEYQQFYLKKPKGFDEKRKEIEAPHGREQLEQHLHCPYTLSDKAIKEGNRYLHVEIVGSIYKGTLKDFLKDMEEKGV